GLLGGMLSLVLANSDGAGEYNDAENNANHYFNRATAYRIFLTYKQQFPHSPVLAQMYSDLITLYSNIGESELMEKLVADFQKRFPGASNYPDLSLQLADTYIRLKNVERARKIYQELLDYLGKEKKPSRSLVMRYQLGNWEANSQLVNHKYAYLSAWNDT